MRMDIRVEAQRTGPVMRTACTATLRLTSTDGFQENARETPTPPTQPMIEPREDRRHSLGVGRVSTGLLYSSAYDKPEKVRG